MTLLSIYIHIEGSNHCVGKLKKYSKWKIHIVNGYTNAEAAYVAAQATMTERYGKGNKKQLESGDNNSTDPVQKLAGIEVSYSYEATYKSGATNSVHDYYLIETFTYKQDGKVARWYRNGSKDGDGDTAAPGGWVVADSESDLPDSK